MQLGLNVTLRSAHANALAVLDDIIAKHLELIWANITKHTLCEFGAVDAVRDQRHINPLGVGVNVTNTMADVRLEDGNED